MTRHFILQRPCLALVLALVASCAGAPRADSALAEVAEGPCELSVEALQEVEQLDRAFAPKHEGPVAEGGAEGYPYAFDDEPLGATVDDGACGCLTNALLGSEGSSCRSALRAAAICLGGPGSARLWAHRNCLPYRVAKANANATITIDYAQNGCTVPDSGFLRVSVEKH